MKLTARNINVQIILDPMQLAGARVRDDAPKMTTMEIAAGGREILADVVTKSLRRAIRNVMEHGSDGVKLIIQGKLTSENSLLDAGFNVQVKDKKPEAEAA